MCFFEKKNKRNRNLFLRKAASSGVWLAGARLPAAAAQKITGR